MENKNKEYVCVMFPYPSADAGFHIGHMYNYSIVDSYCRFLQKLGHEVFQPFGFDSFGLPTENYARKVGKDPRTVTYENIAKFRQQMQRMNTGYEEMFATSDPEYYYWTQWLFLKLKEHDLAYKAMGKEPYCPSCDTVLAREQVKTRVKTAEETQVHFDLMVTAPYRNDINICERCGSVVQEKELEQWYFKITAYRDRMLMHLDWIDYPEKTKNAQRKWLENLHDWCVSRQRPWGCPIPIEGETDTLDTFVDSSFYYVRYCDPHNNNELCAKDKYRQVDLYVGGSEHATMHLIYARFIHMFLYDIGVVPVDEPFKKVFHQGMILNNGEKMAKSKGNVISPDNYDPDVLRFYLMFLGPYDQGGSWSDQNISGITKFIDRMKRWFEKEEFNPDTIQEYGRMGNKFGKLQSELIRYTEAFKFNKVVSTFMIFYNENKEINLSQSEKNSIIYWLEVYMPGIREKIYTQKLKENV